MCNDRFRCGTHNTDIKNDSGHDGQKKPVRFNYVHFNAIKRSQEPLRNSPCITLQQGSIAPLSRRPRLAVACQDS